MVRRSCLTILRSFQGAGVVLLAVVPLLFMSCGDSGSSSWELVWSDEFDGDTVDRSNWTFEVGDGCPSLCGWGNNELEYYQAENATVADGILTITAKEETVRGRDYTSARMITKGKHDWQYGRFEMRAKLPRGQGLWPAFWLLGSNIDSVGWPECGEIDIMEYLGNQRNRVHGTIHGPGYSGGSSVGGQYDIPGRGFDQDFHVFSVEWDVGRIIWSVDGERYQAVSGASIPGNRWVFDHPFFLILNLAVGGHWPGPPDASTVFPQTFEIDYVRVYRRGS